MASGAFQGDIERLKQMLDDGADVNSHPPIWKSVYQPTALAYAVWGNQPEALKLLLAGTGVHTEGSWTSITCALGIRLRRRINDLRNEP